METQTNDPNVGQTQSAPVYNYAKPVSVTITQDGYGGYVVNAVGGPGVGAQSGTFSTYAEVDAFIRSFYGDAPAN